MDAEGENFGKVCDDFINGGMISEVELGEASRRVLSCRGLQLALPRERPTIISLSNSNFRV